jgi:hypothetical protein
MIFIKNYTILLYRAYERGGEVGLDHYKAEKVGEDGGERNNKTTRSPTNASARNEVAGRRLTKIKTYSDRLRSLI